MKKFFKLVTRKQIKWLMTTGCLFFILMGLWFWTARISADLIQTYEQNQSVVLTDRYGKIIEVQPNEKGFYTDYLDKVPEKFAEALIAKEDRFYYYHLGVNPVSTLVATWDKVTGQIPRASSTLTQQLVKILLGQERHRTIGNKVREMFDAFALELHTSKKDILTMYANSAYFGNQVQGLTLASKLYFDANPELLNDAQIAELLVTIPSPSQTNPFEPNNSELTKNLLKKLKLVETVPQMFTKAEIQTRQNAFKNYLKSASTFELSSFKFSGTKLTLDDELNQKIREIAAEEIEGFAGQNVEQAAVVVIKLPENELLSVVGSADPTSDKSGSQINMAVKPRPIGSTIKPFIYTKSFEQGLRPYTLVDDKEYKYTIGGEFAFYPKNYDYKYHGIVNLHYALSNSLNVPTVKVLEYVGLDTFYKFLLEKLGIKPVQDLERYQLGIALGELEMNLLELTNDFSIFGNDGQLKPLRITTSDVLTGTQKKVFGEKYVQLINQILTDRTTGIDQFGMLSNLNLGNSKVAVKTGTSREYHDSWTVGYTPDFVVGVWIGNARNTAMDSVSGSIGAGRIWNRVMQLMLNSDYNRHSTFKTNLLQSYSDGVNLEYGLPNDDLEQIKNLLISEETSLIRSPHAGDTFLLEENTKIPLTSDVEMSWYVNGELLGLGTNLVLEPKKSGEYAIRGESADGQTQEIGIVVEKREE